MILKFGLRGVGVESDVDAGISSFGRSISVRMSHVNAMVVLFLEGLSGYGWILGCRCS